MKYHDPVHTNLADFGFREIAIASVLLRKYVENRQQIYDFNSGGVRLAFNENSGYVFLTNEDYQVLMLNEKDELDIWQTCPECGNEGFKEDLVQSEQDECCIEYLKEFYPESV